MNGEIFSTGGVINLENGEGIRDFHLTGLPENKLFIIEFVGINAFVQSGQVLFAVPQDMAAPGFRLHPLKGEFKGFWAVTVRANWRVIFRFEGEDAADVNLIDYH